MDIICSYMIPLVCFPVRISRHLKNCPAVRVNKELRNIFSKFSFWTAAKERWYKKLPWKPREKHSRDSMSGQIKYHVTLLNGLRSCVRKNFVFLAIFSWQILAQRFPCVFRGFSLKTSFYIEMESFRWPGMCSLINFTSGFVSPQLKYFNKCDFFDSEFQKCLFF